MNRYKIGQLNIGWKPGPVTIAEDNFSELFLGGEDVKLPDILLEGRIMDPSWFQDSKCLRQTGGFELIQTERGRFLMNHWGSCRYGYGFWVDDLYQNNPLPIYFNQQISKEIPLSITRFFSTIGLHSKYLQKGAPIIHASYIDFKGKAILFTAPAQTGKSTQASLWETYMGAEIINGDRVLLSRREDGWYANGYPCCGSSAICLNHSLPIAAIVSLYQDLNNSVCQMRPAEKIVALVSATEVYPWENREINMSFDIAGNIINEVPMVKLACRPDQGAVNVLNEFLEKQDLC